MNKKLKEFESYIKEKKVAIIGLGVSNIPLLEYMNKLGAKVTVFDNREEEKIPKEYLEKISNYGMEHFFGSECLSNLLNLVF